MKGSHDDPGAFLFGLPADRFWEAFIREDRQRGPQGGDAIGRHLEELGMVDKNIDLTAQFKNGRQDLLDERGLCHQPLFGRNGGRRRKDLMQINPFQCLNDPLAR